MSYARCALTAEIVGIGLELKSKLSSNGTRFVIGGALLYFGYKLYQSLWPPENPPPGNPPENLPPGNQPGNQPGNLPGNQPGNQPGNLPGNQPGNLPGNLPGNQPVRGDPRVAL